MLSWVVRYSVAFLAIETNTLAIRLISDSFEPAVTSELNGRNDVSVSTISISGSCDCFIPSANICPENRQRYRRLIHQRVFLA